jgi:hypothetical protein
MMRRSRLTPVRCAVGASPPSEDRRTGVTAEDPHDREEFTTFFDIKVFVIMKGGRVFDEGGVPGAGVATQRQDGGFP